jgi:hypothetical protein
MIGEQTRGAEVVCEALVTIRAALEEVHMVDLPTDEQQGARICRISSQLQQYVHTLARLDMPLANALTDVQNELESLGHYLQLPEEPYDKEEAD